MDQQKLQKKEERTPTNTGIVTALNNSQHDVFYKNKDDKGSKQYKSEDHKGTRDSDGLHLRTIPGFCGISSHHIVPDSSTSVGNHKAILRSGPDPYSRKNDPHNVGLDFNIVNECISPTSKKIIELAQKREEDTTRHYEGNAIKEVLDKHTVVCASEESDQWLIGADDIKEDSLLNRMEAELGSPRKILYYHFIDKTMVQTSGWRLNRLTRESPLGASLHEYIANRTKNKIGTIIRGFMGEPDSEYIEYLKNRKDYKHETATKLNRNQYGENDHFLKEKLIRREALAKDKQTTALTNSRNTFKQKVKDTFRKKNSNQIIQTMAAYKDLALVKACYFENETAQKVGKHKQKRNAINKTDVKGDGWILSANEEYKTIMNTDYINQVSDEDDKYVDYYENHKGNYSTKQFIEMRTTRVNQYPTYDEYLNVKRLAKETMENITEQVMQPPANKQN